MFVYSSYLKITEKTPMAELLSIQEVAQITGLHEITIRRYVHSGELEAVRIGRRIRVRPEAVDRLMGPMRPDPEPKPTPQSEPYLKEGAAVYEVASQRQADETIPGSLAVSPCSWSSCRPRKCPLLRSLWLAATAAPGDDASPDGGDACREPAGPDGLAATHRRRRAWPIPKRSTTRCNCHACRR